jgi:hypothetical protein
MDGIGDRCMGSLEAPSDDPVACAWCMKALNALGARVAAPHDCVRLKWKNDQEWTLQNIRLQFAKSPMPVYLNGDQPWIKWKAKENIDIKYRKYPQLLLWIEISNTRYVQMDTVDNAVR